MKKQNESLGFIDNWAHDRMSDHLRDQAWNHVRSQLVVPVLVLVRNRLRYEIRDHFKVWPPTPAKATYFPSRKQSP